MIPFCRGLLFVPVRTDYGNLPIFVIYDILLSREQEMYLDGLSGDISVLFRPGYLPVVEVVYGKRKCIYLFR